MVQCHFAADDPDGPLIRISARHSVDIFLRERPWWVVQIEYFDIAMTSMA